MLHQTLLERGAESATGVDLSDQMLAHARDRANDRGLNDRVGYELGDFVETQAGFEAADIALLDKVVCCYPAPRELLEATVNKTRFAIGLTYPRKRLANIIWTAFSNFGFWLLRSDFRSFVYEPRLIRGWLEEQGLRQSFSRDTFFWHTQVYLLDQA